MMKTKRKEVRVHMQTELVLAIDTGELCINFLESDLYESYEL